MRYDIETIEEQTDRGGYWITSPDLENFALYVEGAKVERWKMTSIAIAYHLLMRNESVQSMLPSMDPETPRKTLWAVVATEKVTDLPGAWVKGVRN